MNAIGKFCYKMRWGKKTEEQTLGKEQKQGQEKENIKQMKRNGMRRKGGGGKTMRDERDEEQEQDKNTDGGGKEEGNV